MAERGRSIRAVLAALTSLLSSPWGRLVLCLSSPPPRTQAGMPCFMCPQRPAQAPHRELAESERLRSDGSELSAPPGSEPQFPHLKPGLWVVAQGAGWESGDLGSRSVWDVSPCVILGPRCALRQEGLVSSHGRGRGDTDSHAKTSGPEAGEGQRHEGHCAGSELAGLAARARAEFLSVLKT